MPCNAHGRKGKAESKEMTNELKTAAPPPTNGSQETGRRIGLERFQKALNTPPEPKEVKENAHNAGAKYLPISFIEMTLDEMFFGLWETTDFRWQVMGNEVVGSLTLRVFHPVEKIWISRVGAAAAMIRQAKGAKITDIDAKLHNALGMDFPHLKADCLTNAARSLGKMFGRDLNRKFEDAYKPLVTMAAEKSGAVTVEMEQRRVLDSWAQTCEHLLSKCGLEEMQHRGFESRIRTAETPDEYRKIKYELELLMPEPTDDPAKQFGHRENALNGTDKHTSRPSQNQI